MNKQDKPAEPTQTIRDNDGKLQTTIPHPFEKKTEPVKEEKKVEVDNAKIS